MACRASSTGERRTDGTGDRGDFLPQVPSSTLENRQSEFLQLVWQAVGLALLLFRGSSRSKESDERIEAKLDKLLEERGIDPGAVSAEVNRSL
jgi:hypothetical protein